MKRLLLSFALAVLLGIFAGAQEPPVPAIQAAVNGPGAVLEVSFSIPPGLHQSLQHEYFGVNVDTASLPEGWKTGAAVFPPGPREILGVPSYEGTFLVTVPLEPPVQGTSAPFRLRAEVRWQLCYDEGACLLPQKTEVHLEVRPVSGLGYRATAVGADTRNVAPLSADASAFSLEAVPTEPASGEPLFLVLLSAFLGGILLNFMPCVLPVLSLKAVSLVKQAGLGRRGRWLHAWAASTGILASLLGLAAVLIALQAAGAAVGWGVQFQNPWYVAGLSAVVLTFALSLFGVFHLSAPSVRQGKRTGLAGSFFSGFLTVVLATPCTAPFLGTALGAAFASPWWVILLVFGAVGVGLALPFFLVTVIPGTLEKLPKPGPWMAVFQGVMGFALVGTGLWLLTVLLTQVGPAPFSGVLWFLGAGTAVLWLWGRIQEAGWGRWRSRTAAGILAAGLTLGGWILLAPLGSPQTQDREQTTGRPAPWVAFSEARVAEYAAAGRPVFIDFTAEWCLTCKINEAGPLADPEVLKAFASRNLALVRGDYTNADPVITRWLKAHKRAGVPFYALLVPGKEPVIFPELLTKEGLVQALSAPL